jgi:hypothetical protein
LNGANFLFLQSGSVLFPEKNSAVRTAILKTTLTGDSYDCGVKINDSDAAFNTCSMWMCLADGAYEGAREHRGGLLAHHTSSIIFLLFARRFGKAIQEGK